MTEYRAVKASGVLADYKLQTLKALAIKKAEEKKKKAEEESHQRVEPIVQWLHRNASSPGTKALLNKIWEERQE